MKEKTAQSRRPFFTVANFAAAVVCFALFLAAGVAGHYLAVGEFVTAKQAGVLAALALVGGAAVLLRLRRFVFLYYLGCILGWGVGWFISGLKGEFAPTAGSLCTLFIVAVFTLFGVIAQWRAIRKKMARRREEKERSKAEAEAQRLRLELEEAKRERESAGAALAAAAEEASAGGQKEEPAAAAAAPEGAKPEE